VLVDPGAQRCDALVESSRSSAMSIIERLRWQIAGYPDFHRSRGNLLVHIVAVPFFLLCNVLLIRALLGFSIRAAIVAALGMAASMAVQGRAHRAESRPTEPFDGPSDAILRILLEQWITFPRFVLTGGWLRALR
jgi:hypothetical protein